MKDPEPDLSEFFRAERERDLRGAPSFASLATVEVPKAHLRPAWRPRLTAMALMAAAAVAALLVVPRIGNSGADDLDVATTDLDQLCDAALAALDEHEADVLMVTPTDVFLPLGQ